ncbi:hypothetical protein C7M84_025192 [Penaeus vannamei]|uniref:Uncharacterized protein n=1 Tax=Penaeus vannamei TaxID=6689 RepID=A0A423TYW7_PENVA|nr:hypothetical protein C7M84_025192 [Penaeus vannamei]
MVSSVCRGSYPSMTHMLRPHESRLLTPRRIIFHRYKWKPPWSMTFPLTSIRRGLGAYSYDTPRICISRTARSRAVVTPSPTAMVATSGAARPLAPLQLPNPQQPASGRARASRSTQQRTWCMCGNPNCRVCGSGSAPSLLARTPTRGTAGGSPKLRAARTRRGLSVASSVNLPDYLGSGRPARVTGGAVHVHPRPRALSTSMGALAAAPAPPMAHQHMGMGASLTTSLDLARAHALTPRSLQPQAPAVSTSSLLHTVGLSRDSGCSVGAETAGGEWASDRTRGLVDSGFCTPVDLTDDFVADTLSLGGSWKEPSTPLSSSVTSSSSSSGVHTSSLLPGAAHHYLPQPLWNLAY